jgi:hypothetical protein
VKVAEQHRLVGCAVVHHGPKCAGVDLPAHQPARTDADAPLQWTVTVGIRLWHNVLCIQSEDVKLEFAFDYVAGEAGYGFRDALIRRHIPLVLYKHPNGKILCGLAIDLLVSDVYADDSGQIQKIPFRRLLGLPDLWRDFRHRLLLSLRTPESVSAPPPFSALEPMAQSPGPPPSASKR